MSKEDGRKSCLEDCNCDAALYNSGYCTKHKLPSKSTKRVDDNINGFFIFKYQVVEYKWLLDTGNFGSTDEFTLWPFSYSVLKRATNGFKEGLGSSSFGAVYKGVLYNGEKLVLCQEIGEDDVDGSEREFHARCS
ncbi:hypothetical protein Patl1_27809 [Pistacia atlantica]|uniref:Uncharacterized protein n=1 Tax=Pistacia atlantica TaxID=434234 RepID=A0ACC1BEL0_9ROSI|nr:hypothetical protein Patl1_27809 [Pistacia atlantica]